MTMTPFGPLGDSVILALTSTSQTVALGALPGDGPALRLQSLNSGQTAWYIKFGTSGAVTVSVTDGMRIVPGGQDAPVITPVPLGSTHYAILCEGASGNVLASYGGYDDGAFAPVGASQVVAVTNTDQRIALPTLGTISPAIRLVATSPSILALWVKLGNGAVTGDVTTSMKVAPGSVEDPTVIPVTSGETHLSIFCEGVGGGVVLSPGQLDHSLPFPLSRSGDRWGVMPFVGTDGVMEVGRYIDFHNSDADATDHAVRLQTGGGTTDLFVNNTSGPDNGVSKRIVTMRDSTLAQGDVIYYDGTNFVRLAPGVSGQALTTFGAGGNPAWVNQGQQLLASGTVSAAATLDLVLTAYTGFRGLFVELQSFIPATDNVALHMQVSTNGGSSYDSGATDYRYNHLRAFAASSISNTTSTGAPQIVIADGIGNGSAEGIEVSAKLGHRTNTALQQKIGFVGCHHAADNNEVRVLGDGRRLAAQDVDAVRFLFSSGNIASGQYQIYGWA